MSSRSVPRDKSVTLLATRTEASVASTRLVSSSIPQGKGAHQNLTFAVQAVRIRKADPSDRYGDISVDVAKSREAYKEWMAKTRPASAHSPDGTRRPYWMLRPLKPGREVYRR